MTERLKEQYLTFFFALGEHTQANEDDEFEVENDIQRRAYALVEQGYQHLARYIEHVADHDMTLEVPRYELCEDDVLSEIREVVVTWGVGFVAGKPFDRETAEELRDFVLSRYAQAAQGTETSVRFVAAETYEVLEVTRTRPFAGL
jgi:hypothetical protein